jgi:hypothetical protein
MKMHQIIVYMLNSFNNLKNNLLPNKCELPSKSFKQIFCLLTKSFKI